MNSNVSVNLSFELSKNIILKDNNKLKEPLSPIKFIEKFIYDDIRAMKRRKNKISEDDFVIPKYREYDLLLKNNYNVCQLKKVCNHYKVKKSGNKNEILFRIYNYLHYSYYIIKIQKIYRGYLQRKFNKSHGPAFFKRNICVNNTDFCTLDKLKEIPYEQFFSFKSKNGQIYGCDICSLYNLIQKHKKKRDPKDPILPLNPYDRLPLPKKLPLLIDNYFKLSAIYKIKLNIIIQNDFKNCTYAEQIKQNTLRIFQQINELGNYSDLDWFSDLNKIQLILFIKELYDIWNYRAGLSDDTKINICHPNGNPFCHISVHNFTHLSKEEIQKTILIVMEKFVNNGINRDFKSLGAYYILSALTLVNITAAESLPWLYQSVAH